MNEFNNISKKIISTKIFQNLKKYPSHGTTSVYTHSINVAYRCLKYVNKHNIKCKKEELVRGALLHDFYLYNWHHSKIKFHTLKHPTVALNTAKRYFKLTKREENIIYSHMFPITILKIPKYKEAWIVCLFDKIIAIKEIIKKH